MSGVRLFSTISTEGTEKVVDSVGGYTPLESNVYKGTVTSAYVTASQTEGSLSQGLNLVIKLENGTEYRETIYFLSKEGLATTEKNGKLLKRREYVLVDDLSLLASEIPFSDALFEEKLVQVWDNDAQARIPKPMMTLVDVLDKEFYFAIQTTKKFKQEHDGSGWVDTDRVIHESKIQKIMSDEGFTVLELIEGVSEAVFIETWRKAHGNKIVDRTANGPKGGAKKGVPGQAPGAAAKPAGQLFKRRA